jgi:hypothetical protein
MASWKDIVIRAATQTTTNTANQVIASYALPAESSCVLDVRVTGNKKATNDSVTGTLSISTKRNGSGAPARVGGDDVVIKKTAGLAISGANGIHLEFNGNSLEVQVDPNETVTLDWAVLIRSVEVVSP